MNNPSTLSPVAALYRGYAGILDKGQSLLLLLIRLTWGFQFAQTGWGKWHDIPKVVGFFTNIGIPLPTLNAYVVATTELVGGTFLLLGLLSRLTPIPLIISMIVAYATTEQDALHSLISGNPDPFLTAAPFLFLFASLIVFVFGPGAFSLDRLWLGKSGDFEKSSRAVK
ncbi:MAG TPA: DoxX family protein [Chthoniobacterales bacterium]|nr:DoxX family protein [Chthoniobacterales bacterium]